MTRPHCPRCGGYGSQHCSWCQGRLRLLAALSVLSWLSSFHGEKEAAA
jgi:hypothetical protein